MKIGFDLRPFLREETGVGIYFRNLLIQLAEMDQNNEYFLFSSSWKDRFEPSRVPPFRRMQFRDFRWPVRAVNFFWHNCGCPRLDFFFRTKLDLTHSPTPLILPTAGKKVVTVCDLFFLDFPGKADREARRSFLKKTKSALERADGIVTISRFTQDAVRERFGLDERKMRVTYLGLSPVFNEAVSPDELEETRRTFGLPPEFVLFVGATEPRKNLLNLVEALRILHQKKRNTALVIVGRKGGDHENLKKRISACGLESRVKILGYLPEKELKCLYHLAAVFTFPSYCEGFGLPLLEAMACGVPVVASGVAALPEVARDAAIYFRPDEPEDIADQILLVLEDENLRRALKERGKKRAQDFSWKKTAAETLEFYRTLLENR